ncbi:MAG: hypothetical protein U9Q24_00415 [Candidatus Ratteibacteria bacterium]|nr:hypothetical protein [Candidatus Ratteibacteria bacterium]
MSIKRRLRKIEEKCGVDNEGYMFLLSGIPIKNYQPKEVICEKGGKRYADILLWRTGNKWVDVDVFSEEGQRILKEFGYKVIRKIQANKNNEEREG